MKKMDRIVNKIKISMIHKKNFLKIKIEKKELNLLKIFIKLNIILHIKKITKNIFIIKLNDKFNLKIKNFFKKKKITIKQNTKNKKNILIISNNNGINIKTKNDGGVIL